MRIINTAILSNPINWVKVPLMALIGMVGLYLVVQLVSTKLPENED